MPELIIPDLPSHIKALRRQHGLPGLSVTATLGREIADVLPDESSISPIAGANSASQQSHLRRPGQPRLSPNLSLLRIQLNTSHRAAKPKSYPFGYWTRTVT